MFMERIALVCIPIFLRQLRSSRLNPDHQNQIKLGQTLLYSVVWRNRPHVYLR